MHRQATWRASDARLGWRQHNAWRTGWNKGLQAGALIEQNKDRCYETLEQSSRGWHEGQHDPWPYVSYLLYILKTAYLEFEDRLGQTHAPRGEKSQVVLSAIKRAAGDFAVADLQQECPGVSLDMIRHVLKGLRRHGAVECLGKGRSARWRGRKP